MLGHSKSVACFSSPLSPKIDAGGRHFWRVMVVKITSLVGNGRQNYKFNLSKIEAGYFYSVLVQMESHVGRNQGGMRNN